MPGPTFPTGQQVQATNFSAVSSLIITLPSGIASGAVLGILVNWDSSGGVGAPTSYVGTGGTLGTVTDSGKGTQLWTPGGASLSTVMGVALAPASGITQVTVNFSGAVGGNGIVGYLWEIDGLTLPASIDKVSVTTDSVGLGSTFASGSSGTLSQNVEAAIGLAFAGNTVSTVNSPWSNIIYSANTGAGQGWQVTSTNAAVNFNGTLNSGSQPFQSWVLTLKDSSGAAAPPTGWMSAGDDLPRRRYVPGYDVGLLPIAPRPQFLAQGIAIELPPRRRLILPEGPTFAQPPAAGTPTPNVLWNAPDDNPRQKKPPLDPGAPLPLFQASTIVAPPNGWQSPGDQLPARRPVSTDQAGLVFPLPPPPTAWLSATDQAPPRRSVNTEAGLLPVPPAPTLWYLAGGEQLPPARRPPTDAAGLQQQVTFTPVSGMAWAGTPGDNVVSRPLTWLLSSTAFSPQVIAPPPPPPSGVHYITTSRGKLIAVIGVS